MEGESTKQVQEYMYVVVMQLDETAEIVGGVFYLHLFLSATV